MKLILIFGGQSLEHKVSIATAQNISTSSMLKFDYWYWTENGEVLIIKKIDLKLHRNPFKKDFQPLFGNRYKNIKDAIIQESSVFDVFILGLHGGDGENGQFQKLLENYNRKYTGSKSKACHLAMNKIVSRLMMEKAGLCISPACAFQDCEVSIKKKIIWFFLSKFTQFVIKPVAEGSSIGCFFLSFFQKEEFSLNITNLLEKNLNKSFIETFIDGREFTVGVYNEFGVIHSLVPTEICKKAVKIANYKDKYWGKYIVEKTPAEIPIRLLKKLQFISKKAHVNMGCYGYSRSDMILDRNGNVFYLETNTLPGLSKVSLYPQALHNKGISIDVFLKNQIEITLSHVKR
ncbi:MAG: hypothetical protein HYS16_00820 [Deltaproteobacteria bacterium]|nr:MAG: hypothetical protein HYS16_00820 [Deltaproteobacteria bacterium]